MAGDYLWQFEDIGYILCTVEPVQKQEQRWMACVRIYFVLSGRMQLRVGAKSFPLRADDIILINKGELFAVTEGDGFAATFDLDISRPERRNPELWFDLNPSGAAGDRQVVVLKEFLARFIKFNLDLAQDKRYLNRSLYYAIIHHLLSFFRVEKPVRSMTDAHMLDRADQISRYINAHYHEALTLESLSRQFFLSAPYMSKMFKQYFGSNFSAYLTNLRVQSSIPELQRGELTIEEIAGLCGFSDSRSYISNFRKKYNITPGEYRRQMRAQESGMAPSPVESMGLAQSRQLQILARYLENDEVDASSTDSGPAVLTEIPLCDIRAKGDVFSHHYQKLCSIGRASDLLQAENQSMVKTLQQEIGFSFILFHGLLDDDMLTYSVVDGKSEISFASIDKAFDFLLSVGLKPFVELSYMPHQLARPNAPVANNGRSCISLPSDMEQWMFLVSSLVRHLNQRYGKREVAAWPFSLWNLPDSGESIFGLGSVTDYFGFYSQTIRAVRQQNKDVRFCGPSCLPETMEEGSYYSEFLRLCQEHGCFPQFAQYHFYPMRKKAQLPGEMRSEPHLVYRSSPNALRDSLLAVSAKLPDSSNNPVPLLVTEWNATVSHRELLNDTAFQSAYIAKNALETVGLAEALCYWTLSDSINEVRPSAQLFHGGLGLFTQNGIKKASYQSLRLLSRLGNIKLSTGEGWFLSRSENGVQILLYNYQHYSQLYADGEQFDMSFLNRYTPFVNPVRRKFSLELTGFTAGRYLIKESLIDRAHGSSFDCWVESGALSLDNEEERLALQSLSYPSIHKRIVSSPDGRLSLSLTLEPHAVLLVEITEY